MKKKIIILLSLCLLSLLLVACGNNTANENFDSINNVVVEATLPETENNTLETTNDTENIEEANNEDLAEEETNDIEEVLDDTIEVIDPEGKIFSKLTGLEITEEESLKRPIVVMLDNHYKARPQAGLSDAEVIYEVLAEGSITRYMAVIQSKTPEVVGPIRSARPYFIERALEFNPLYVHVGGSMQALTDIINYKVADIEGLSVGAGVFYRTDHKNMPHNAYSSHDGIRKEATRKGFYEEVEFSGMPITYQPYQLEGESCNHVTIQYKAPSAGDAIGYSIAFRYMAEENHYIRYVNGEEHLDEETKIQLYADNIIIQKATHKVLDSAGRREIGMISTGQGYYVNKGVYIPITWKKENLYAQTKYYYEDGSELLLNPGITWIQVIKPTMEPIFE